MSDPRNPIFVRHEEDVFETLDVAALNKLIAGTGWRAAYSKLLPSLPDCPAIKYSDVGLHDDVTFPSGYTYPTSGLYVHAPKNGDPNPARVVRCTGLDPAAPIKSKTPEVPVTFQQGHELDVEFFRYAESPTVRPDGPTVEQVRTRTPDWKHVDFASEATLKPAAPFYEHNEEKIAALQLEGVRLDSVVTRQRVYIHRLDAQNDQLRFLLSQAPIRTAPVDLREAAHSVTKYAYINRKTFRHATREVFANDRWTEPYYTIAPSPTKWVMTDLMPDGVVIYTPNEMPKEKP